MAVGPDLGAGSWSERRRSYRNDWTSFGQGAAVADDSWFVTSNGNPGLYRYSADFSTLEAQVDIPRSTAGHVGAVAVHNDVVYVALENPEVVATFSLGLTPLEQVKIDRPIEVDGGPHLAWCAINAANGLLYTCDWNHAARLDAYDALSGERRSEADVTLPRSVHRAQGGVFTADGLVLLASDDRHRWGERIRGWLRLATLRPVEPGIHAFDAEGGDMGYRPIRVRVLPPYFEELEGIGLGPMTIDGVVSHVHVALLDRNFSWINDDVEILSFTVPDPSTIGF